MQEFIFQPADILLPADPDLTRWSVIACDQFTSDGNYWERVRSIVDDSPSTLHMMLPEYYLGKCDEKREARRIQSCMREYLNCGMFRTLDHSIIYLKRKLPNGKTRCGLVGQVDLEAYDYAPDSCSPIRATEGTVESRLPARVMVREQAALEMPHIMLFFNDPKDIVMQQAACVSGEVVYDFDLMLNGGHLTGKRISGGEADAFASFLAKHTKASDPQYAVGDGNHSLAAARKFWLEKRERLSRDARAKDPARFALVELVNIHDPAIEFEPIHRVLLHTDTASFFSSAKQALECSDSERTVTFLASGKRLSLPVKGASIGETIDLVESFCRTYTAAYGGEIDYIHGNLETEQLAEKPDTAGILLPIFEKEELFSSVARSGPFPKKSFSIGLGPDKRYYLECRKL